MLHDVKELLQDVKELLQDVKELLQDVKELLDHLKKSSHVLEQAVAVLSVLRHDGFCSKSVLDESLHVVLKSRSVVSGSRDDRFESRASSTVSFDVRSSLFAVIEELVPYRSGRRAYRSWLQSSL